MYALIAHGGAGSWRGRPSGPVLEVMRAAVGSGRDLLDGGGDALTAVVEVVRLLEDDPQFNAGTGSVLNLDGDAEMDAAVMDGRSLSTGAVAALRRVRNPVLVARKVMEMTDHVLLAGGGAVRFARAVGFDEFDPVTAQRREEWHRRTQALAGRRGDEKIAALHALLREAPREGQGTVGAVALDVSGGLAAATSTGGMMLKLPGRVGDSPVPGAGNYATGQAAVSATGRGELMLRFLTAKAVCDAVAGGRSAAEAVGGVLAAMRSSVGIDVGIIALDAAGRPGIGHLTEAMPHAYAVSGEAGIVAAMACPR